MKALSILAGLALLVAVLAAAPAAQAMELPPQCVTSPCCFAPCPPPCYDCPPPGACSKVATEVSTSDLLAYLGPHASVALHADCSLSLAESGTVCPSFAPEAQTVGADAGPVDVSAQACVPAIYCTCDPILDTQ